MKINSTELKDLALDWAVAKCEGFTSTQDETETWLEHADGRCGYSGQYNFSTDWRQGGPIIEREKITVAYNFDAERWEADTLTEEGDGFHNSYGPTPLIAAMRCFVASKLGDEVDVPGELM